MKSNRIGFLPLFIKFCNLCVLTLLLGLFSGCGLLGERSFLNEMENEGSAMFVPEQDFPVVQGDKGSIKPSKSDILERTPLSKEQKLKLTAAEVLAKELKELEDSLPEVEYHHYLKNKSKLPHSSERIYFLRLAGMRERDEYLLGKGFNDDYVHLSPKESEAVRQREIVVGMSKDAVIQSWGQPLRVDVAGNPVNENERWAFAHNLGKVKYVFFENGRVRGWLLE